MLRDFWTSFGSHRNCNQKAKIARAETAFAATVLNKKMYELKLLILSIWEADQA